MFTGLIEAVGKLREMKRSAGGASLVIACPAWVPPLTLGESVAVQGACLTVTAFDETAFVCDVLDETLARTTLSSVGAGNALNLERALKLGDRLGGHMVTGHIDGTGEIAAIRSAGRDRVLSIRCDPVIAAGVVEKGSIAIDGISLTVSAVREDAFDVHIIPHTWDYTSLCECNQGGAVNLETDMLGKYVQRHLSAMRASSRVDLSTLANAGFMSDD